MTVKLRRLATSASNFEAEFQRLQHWSAETDAAIESRVAEIIADVRARGDTALLELSARFDGVQASTMADLEIGADELGSALQAITPAQRSALEVAAARVRSYHEQQMEAACRSWSYRDADGTLLGQ
jgi:histidinol dehydrogenase